MGFIFKGILAVIWLLVVPCLAGGFYFRREKRTCGEYLLAGYTLLFAITELLSLTMIFTKAAASCADHYIWRGGWCTGISGCPESL